MVTGLLDELIASLNVLPDAERDETVRLSLQSCKHLVWVPNPGPQTAAFESAADELYYGGMSGGGKDLCLDTPIPTPHGFTTMGAIRKDDYVLADDGMPCKVVARSEIFSHECYRLTFSDATEVVCGSRHEWVTDQRRVRTARQIADALQLQQDTLNPGVGVAKNLQMPTRELYIVKAERCESVPTRCIQVDSQSRMYLCTTAMIPTHNSDLTIGLALTQHEKSLILRRFNDDAKVLAERTMAIVGSRDGYNGQAQILRLPRRMMEFGGAKDLEDRQRYKGDPHDLVCVSRGTPVLLANGSYKAVESLRMGEMLQTLEGPRRLERIHPTQRKQCVQVIAYDLYGKEIARQVQSSTHSLMFDGGWFSAADLAAAYAPIQSHEIGRQRRSSSEIYECYGSSPSPKTCCFLHRGESALQSIRHKFYAAMRAVCRLSGEGIYFSEFAYGHGDDPLPHLLFCRATRHGQTRQLSAFGFLPTSRACADFYAQTWLVPQDSPENCSNGIRLYGEHIPTNLDFSIGAEVGQRCLLLRVDVELPNPNHSIDRALDGTQTHTHQRRMYSHPYTKETRSIAVSGSLLSAALDISFVGEREVFDLQVNEVNHYITCGGFINKNCFDEISDFLEAQYTFIIGWNRSTTPGQRCRVVCTGNPPTTPEGLWVMKRWGAWIDPTHARFGKVKEGELLWYTTIDGKDTEVDGPGPHMIEGEPIIAKSRTFIRARLADNPDLSQTNYDAVLAGLPEELRDAYREGKFEAGLKDKPWQMVPTAWVRAAQARWTDRPPDGVPMCAMAVDCTGGGVDPMIIGARHDGWYAPLIVIPGHEIPPEMAGRAAAGHVVAHRRDNALMIIDMGGGYGGPLYEHLHKNFDEGVEREPKVKPFKGSEGTVRRAHDKILSFNNCRTASIWLLREALDPGQVAGSPIMLPPDDELLADLTAVTYEIRRGIIHAEPKEDVCARLGRSTNKGDTVCMAWFEGPIASTHGAIWDEVRKEMGRSGRLGGRRPTAIMGRHNARR